MSGHYYTPVEEQGFSLYDAPDAVTDQEREIAEYEAALAEALADPEGQWVLCGGALVRRGTWKAVEHNGEQVPFAPGEEDGSEGPF